MAIGSHFDDRTVSRDPIDRLVRAFLSAAGVDVEDSAPPPPEAWPRLLPQLREHRLMPAAHWVVRRSNLRIPSEASDPLESAFYGASLRHEQLHAALAEIAGALSQKGLQAIALKGMALADSAYPHPACRPMEDLDLLVRPDDRGAVSEVLVSLGYIDRSFGVEDFRNPATGVVVDLHAELLNTTEISVRRKVWDPPLAEWWRRGARLTPHPSLLTFSSADHLEYLCHHAWLHHGLRKPLNLMDISLVYSQLQHRPAPAAGESGPDSLGPENPQAATQSLEPVAPHEPHADSPAPSIPHSAIRNPQSSTRPLPSSPDSGLPQFAFRNAQFEIGGPPRAAWYTLAACRFHLGLRLSEQLLQGLRPARVSRLEKLLHRAASRGLLPDSARHLCLWYALPPRERIPYLRQALIVGRSALWPGTQRAEGCPRQQ